MRLIMTCGTDTTRKISSIVEGASLQYSITLEAPAFCDWRHGQSSPMSNLDLLPSRLLQELQGWCTNYTTNGWWTYEYCYPDSLIQFHLEHSTGNAQRCTFLSNTIALIELSLCFILMLFYSRCGRSKKHSSCWCSVWFSKRIIWSF